MSSHDKEALDRATADWARDHDHLTAEIERLREALTLVRDVSHDGDRRRMVDAALRTERVDAR